MGRLAIVLHAHLPYVLEHGIWPHGEDWLNEAAAECYLPLLLCLEGLAAEGRRSLLTLSFSPILCEQLAHAAWQARFLDYLKAHERAAAADAVAFQARREARLSQTARAWQAGFARARERFAALEGNILSGFRALADLGALELFSCAATHGYLPLLLPGLSRC